MRHAVKNEGNELNKTLDFYIKVFIKSGNGNKYSEYFSSGLQVKK